MQIGEFFRSLKTKLLKNSIQGEDFQKTPLDCLHVHRKPGFLQLNCIHLPCFGCFGAIRLANVSLCFKVAAPPLDLLCPNSLHMRLDVDEISSKYQRRVRGFYTILVILSFSYLNKVLYIAFCSKI